MSKDFRASQVETSKIIASGAIAAGKPLGLAIYSGSVASNREGGTTDSAMFSKVGSDVFLFVSGTISNSDFNRTEATLFGGDVVISGTLYAERQVIEVDGLIDGDMFVTGNLLIKPDANSLETFVVRNNSNTKHFTVDTVNSLVAITGSNVEIAHSNLTLGPDNNGGIVTLHSADVYLMGQNADPTNLQNNNSTQMIGFYPDAGAPLTLSGNSTNIFLGGPNEKFGRVDIQALETRVRGQGGQVAIHVTASDAGATTPSRIYIASGTLSSPSDPDPKAFTDTIFYVSGAIGSKNTTNIGTSVFGGDVAISGSTFVENDLSLLANSSLRFNNPGENDQFINGNNSTLTIDADNILALNYDTVARFKLGTEEQLEFSSAGAIFNDLGLAANDFRVESDNLQGAILIDSGDDTITLGSNATSFAGLPGAAKGTDVKIVLSGTVRSKGTGTRGVVLMPGDLVVSGTTYHENNVQVTGSIQVNGDIAVETGHSIFFNGDAGDISIKSTNGNNLFIDADDLLFIDFDSSLGFRFGGSNRFNIDTDSVFVNSDRADSDFYVNTDTKYGTLYVDAGDDSIILGNESFDSSPAASEVSGYANDVKIMLSGTVGTKGTTTRGVTLLSGDAHMSGAVSFTELTSAPNANSNEAVLYAKDDSGITKLFMKQSDGVEVGPLGSGGSLDDAYDTPPGGGTKASGLGGKISIDGQPVQLTVTGGKTMALAVTGAVAFGNTSVQYSNQLPPLPGSDTQFFVSGAIGKKDISGTSVFGGDLVISGSSFHEADISLIQGSRIRFNNPGENDIFIYANNDNSLRIDGDNSVDFFADTSFSFSANSNSITVEDTKIVMNSGVTDSDFYVNSSNYFGTFFIDGGDNTVIIGNQGFDGTPQASEVSGYGNDVKIMLSGSAMSRGTSTRGVTLVTGDLVVSGGLYGGRLASNEDNTSFVDLSQNTIEINANHNVLVHTAQAPGNDTNFFVSGSIDSAGTNTRGTAAFGGDVVVSGTLKANGFPLVYDHYIPSALSDSETYLSQLGTNTTSNPTGATLGYLWHVFHHSASLKSVTHFHSNDSETIAVGFYNYGDTPNSGYLPKCHATGSTISQQWSTSNRDRGFGTIDFTGKTLTVSGSNIINPGDLIAMFIKRIDGAPGPSYNVISFNFETYNYD
jgi:hypothetical protein